MPSQTAKYGINYPLSTDSVASVALTVQNAAARMDLLLGESGVVTVSPGANVLSTTAVVLGRTYPGNSGAAVPGIVVLDWNQALAPAAAQANMWITAWTGTATTITGFSINFQCTAAQAARNILWRFLPVL